MRYLPLLLTLLVSACEPSEELNEALEVTSQRVEESMISVYPYFTNWDYCIINGERIDDVQFMYTDIGLGYMVESGLYYKLDMVVEYCEGAVLAGGTDG
jgi:hypothetical protein